MTKYLQRVLTSDNWTPPPKEVHQLEHFPSRLVPSALDQVCIPRHR